MKPPTATSSLSGIFANWRHGGGGTPITPLRDFHPARGEQLRLTTMECQTRQVSMYTISRGNCFQQESLDANGAGHEVTWGGNQQFCWKNGLFLSFFWLNYVSRVFLMSIHAGIPKLQVSANYWRFPAIESRAWMGTWNRWAPSMVNRVSPWTVIYPLRNCAKPRKRRVANFYLTKFLKS